MVCKSNSELIAAYWPDWQSLPGVIINGGPFAHLVECEQYCTPTPTPTPTSSETPTPTPTPTSSETPTPTPTPSSAASSGPLIGSGQTLAPFTLSGAPNPWANHSGNINGTYVDESNFGPLPTPGYNWVIVDPNSPYGYGEYRISWWSNQGSCECYDGNYNVIGTRQLGEGWLLYTGWGGSTMIAFAPGANASIPPSTGWYKIYMAGGSTPACSGPFGGDGSTPYGFSDCDPSIQPPTENWQPGFVTNLTFTPAML